MIVTLLNKTKMIVAKDLLSVALKNNINTFKNYLTLQSILLYFLET